MPRDYGSGMTIDELIGMNVIAIHGLDLPRESLYKAINKATGLLMGEGFEMLVLVELWGDGNSVWQDPDTKKVVVVTPDGQLNQSQD